MNSRKRKLRDISTLDVNNNVFTTPLDIIMNLGLLYHTKCFWPAEISELTSLMNNFNNHKEAD